MNKYDELIKSNENVKDLCKEIDSLRDEIESLKKKSDHNHEMMIYWNKKYCCLANAVGNKTDPDILAACEENITESENELTEKIEILEAELEELKKEKSLSV